MLILLPPQIQDYQTTCDSSHQHPSSIAAALQLTPLVPSSHKPVLRIEGPASYPDRVIVTAKLVRMYESLQSVSGHACGVWFMLCGF